MDSRQQFEEWASRNNLLVDKTKLGTYCFGDTRDTWLAWQASRESMVMDIRQTAKKWFYESFDDELLEKMQNHGLIAQAEGFSVSVMAELELEIESAMNTNGIRTK